MRSFLAPKDLILPLQTEISGNKYTQYDRLFITENSQVESTWAQLVLDDCEIHEFASISEAVKILKSRGKWWANYSHVLHRRSQLIQEQLPKNKKFILDFLQAPPVQDNSFWSLLDNNKLFLAKKTNSLCPLGEVPFKESSTPPSRAYLKLWELFTVHGIKPKAGDTVLDMGSCPGGWTWVLQQLGCQVISVDKAPLDPKISRLSKIKFIKQDAFKLDPKSVGPVDWFFSDIICYPEKLLELIQKWTDLKMAHHFVTTIKFQGTPDYTVLDKFRALGNSRIVHLFHNKHEVTFIKLKE